MNISYCQSPLAWDTLLSYWLAELDPDGEGQVEEHYLDCDQCSHRLEQLVALAQEVCKVTKMSGVSVVINEQFVHSLLEQGMRVREYRVPLNGAVNCTVAHDDDFVVAYLEAPLEEVKQLDLIYLDSDGEEGVRLEDIPFIATSGLVVFTSRIDALRALPTTSLRLRLLTTDNDEERSIGEYTFNHTSQDMP